MKNSKKAFTLMELLIVVVVLGVLASAAVPKFKRVLETRRTTEAEELMAAVRTEQEKRCVLGKNYTKYVQNIPELAKAGLDQGTRSQNYEYNLLDKGIVAIRKNDEGTERYTLQMWYKTGEICCFGMDCDTLNKNYPPCEEEPMDECAGDEPEPIIECESDATEVEDCGCNGTGQKTRTRSCIDGKWQEWSAWSACSDTEAKQEETVDCGCGGGIQTRARTCNFSTGKWGNWVDVGSCEPDPDDYEEVKLCGCKQQGKYGRSVTCDRVKREWVYGEWSACNAVNTDEICCSDQPVNKIWDEEKQECVGPCGNVNPQDIDECEAEVWPGLAGSWNYGTCECDCPEYTHLNNGRNCEPNCDMSKLSGCENPFNAHAEPGEIDYEDCVCMCPSCTEFWPGNGCMPTYDEDKYRWCEYPGHTGDVGTWNEQTCDCDCPEGTEWDPSSSSMACENSCMIHNTNITPKCIENCRQWDGVWDDQECTCRCPQGTWDRRTCNCVQSDCEPNSGDFDRDKYWHRIDDCRWPSHDQMAGVWNPVECRCDCPYPYYEGYPYDYGCILAKGHSADEYDPDCQGGQCEEWDWWNDQQHDFDQDNRNDDDRWDDYWDDDRWDDWDPGYDY